MRQLFENAIKNIEELITLRTKQIEILADLEKSKEATTIQFKLKSYRIWINLLRGSINKGIEIKKKEDIQGLKLTKSLENNLIELFETSSMQDLEKAHAEVAELEKTLHQNSLTLFSSVNSHASLTNSLVDKVDTIGSAKGGIGSGVDTSKIEAQPKILSQESRPTDARGGAIFDLRYVYGIGPKNAEKLVDSGVSLEGLLEDWTKWIKADPANAILMPSKMPTPPGYTRVQWIQVPEERQRTIQMMQLTKRLERETRFLGKLNSHQLLGVKWFHDMSQKIPRAEVQRAERILQAAAKHMNAELQITLCGSYRRGRAKSGDIDCLITHPGIETMTELENYPVNILAKFVELLTNLDFLIDHLTDYGRSKYMGFCMIKQTADKKPTTARRIDIRFIPYNSYGAAILYFTGSKLFNTQMRTWALGRGYSLNEYGLKKVKGDDIFISCKTEEEVFKILEYPYKTPEQRDI